MRDYAVDGVGDRRVDRATGFVARAEHEVVDEQLGSPVEQRAEGPQAVVRVEAILLFQSHPRQVASQLRELVAEPRVFLLADEEQLAGGEPFFACPGRVIGHRFSPSSWRVSMNTGICRLTLIWNVPS